MKQLFLVAFALLLSYSYTFGQSAAKANDATETVQKTLTATEHSGGIAIDGKLNEAIWQEVPVAGNFIVNQPNAGEPSRFRSEVRVLYSNQALYIGATLFDHAPDSIARDLCKRDDFGNTDWFAVIIDAYRDGINGVGFVVTPAGVQLDTKYLPGNQGEDVSWDAVWASEVTLTDKGWVVEMKIPYSAIRFPKATEQKWHVNFGRFNFRTREKSFWNEIKPDQALFLKQCGLIEGIKNITSPVRLSATPYVAARVENFHDNNASPKDVWGRSINGGMDIKYGINDAFTLDATLIPDFGQVRSDAQVLNLSPFEVRFNENRPFFTEGIELFNKGNIFYSRRIGGRPIGYYDVRDQLQEGETVKKNPTESQLLNATKISGRTGKGLGIGFFNAVSARTEATINTATGGTRTIETAPLTNYNIMVFDQNLKNNSFVTFTNTNLLRNGASYYDANVSNLKFSLRNKANTYETTGGATLSQQYFADTLILGHQYSAGFAKTSGNFQFETGYNEESYNYNPNDLGYLFFPNERTVYGYAQYGIYKPFGKFNRFNGGVGFEYSRLHRPDKFNNFGINYNTFWLTKKNIGVGVWGGFEPITTYDFTEPRTDDFSRFYTYPTNFRIGGFYSSDYSKTVAYDVNLNYRRFNEPQRYTVEPSVYWRLRFSDKFFLNPSTAITYLHNDVGYVFTDAEAQGYADLAADDIIFCKRNQLVVENYLGGSYTFNNKMNFTLGVRHYWTTVDYHHFFLLDKEGLLKDTPYKGKDNNNAPLHNITFDAFTVDAIFTWRFAPGSDLVAVWKNNIFAFDDDLAANYFKHTGNLFNNPQTNSIAIKVLYFLDYLNFRKK